MQVLTMDGRKWLERRNDNGWKANTAKQVLRIDGSQKIVRTGSHHGLRVTTQNIFREWVEGKCLETEVMLS